MAGITDLPNRLICKELGADVLYSEMVSATGLCLNKANLQHYVNSSRQDYPLFLQLFGSQHDHFIKALDIINQLPSRDQLSKDDSEPRKPEGIDLNFGCPVKKVIKQGAGCALMGDLAKSRQIIKSVVENTDLEVSIKIRAGFNGISALDFVDNVADLDWSTVIIHGRTFSQGFSGDINLKMIKRLKKIHPNKNVIANGGIFSPKDAKYVLDHTSADGVAIARGALGNPWIFDQSKQYVAKGFAQQQNKREIKRIINKHLYLFVSIKGDGKIQEMRKHFGWYVRGLPDARSLRKKIYAMNSLQEAEHIIRLI